MSMCYSLKNGKRNGFFVSQDCHPQTIALVRTRGSSIGLDIVVGDATSEDFDSEKYCGVLLQVSPRTNAALCGI